MKLVKESLIKENNDELSIGSGTTKEEFFVAANKISRGSTFQVNVIYGDHDQYNDDFTVGNFVDGPFKSKHYYIFFGNKDKSMNIDKTGSTDEGMRVYTQVLFSKSVDVFIPWKNITLL